VYLLVADIADFEQNFLNAWRRHELADDDPVHIEAEGEENPGEDQSGERDRPRKTSVSSGRQKSSRSSEHASDAAEDHRLQESQPDSEAEANGADGSLLRRNVLIFVENEQLEVPLLLEGMNDSQLFKQLRMFYRYVHESETWTGGTRSAEKVSAGRLCDSKQVLRRSQGTSSTDLSLG
jgi:hypothetical protein